MEPRPGAGQEPKRAEIEDPIEQFNQYAADNPAIITRLGALNPEGVLVAFTGKGIVGVGKSLSEAAEEALANGHEDPWFIPVFDRDVVIIGPELFIKEIDETTD